MNKRGQIFILRWMTVLFILFLTFGYLQPFKDTITTAQNSTNLDCDNSSITVGTQITCLGLDLTLWYFIFAIIVAGVGILWERKSRTG